LDKYCDSYYDDYNVGVVSFYANEKQTNPAPLARQAPQA
jgi:hypothetical protein